MTLSLNANFFHILIFHFHGHGFIPWSLCLLKGPLFLQPSLIRKYTLMLQNLSFSKDEGVSLTAASALLLLPHFFLVWKISCTIVLLESPCPLVCPLVRNKISKFHHGYLHQGDAAQLLPYFFSLEDILYNCSVILTYKRPFKGTCLLHLFWPRR